MKQLGILMMILATVLGYAQSPAVNKPLGLEFSAEYGYTSVLKHQIQFGKNGTLFDFVEEGNQDVLLPYSRFSIAINFAQNHNLVFLYQPIEIATEAYLTRNVTEQSVTFTNGSLIAMRYSFPFYRLSYLYDFIRDKNLRIAAGVSLQIRNTVISFKNLTGTKLVYKDNVGPVPVLKFIGSYTLDNGIYFLTDIDGFWASSALFNGAAFEFEGSVLDASLRTGWKLSEAEDVFFNARFIGGTARGTGTDTNRIGDDGYSENGLATVNLSFGVNLRY